MLLDDPNASYTAPHMKLLQILILPDQQQLLWGGRKEKKHIHGSLKMQWQKQHLKPCVQNSPILLLQMETVKEEKQKKQKPAFVSSRAIPYDPGSCIRWFGSFGKAFRVSPWIRHCNTLSSISLAQCHNSFCVIHCTFC